MSARTLNRKVKPLTITLASILLLTLMSTAAAAQTISVNYSLQANKTSSVQRQWSLSNGQTHWNLTESRSDSLSANGAATVHFMDPGLSANGTITITRDGSVSFKAYRNNTLIANNTGSEMETTVIKFSGTGSEEVLDHFGPLKGHPTGTLENLTINGQTILAVHLSRSFTNHFTTSVQETATRTIEGQTVTMTVSRTLTRDITMSADFWFAKNSGILLKSIVQGSVSINVTANGTITGGPRTQTFSMNATFSESFSRIVMATSISGLT